MRWGSLKKKKCPEDRRPGRTAGPSPREVGAKSGGQTLWGGEKTWEGGNRDQWMETDRKRKGRERKGSGGVQRQRRGKGHREGGRPDDKGDGDRPRWTGRDPESGRRKPGGGGQCRTEKQRGGTEAREIGGGGKGVKTKAQRERQVLRKKA